MLLPDPVPIGVSGALSISLAQYTARTKGRLKPAEVLLDEGSRVTYLAGRLSEALNRPLTNPGSERLARAVIAQFSGTDLMQPFAEKALETLRDGNVHSLTAVSPNHPRVAVVFVAWRGTYRDVQSQRIGRYFQPLVSNAQRLVQSGIQLSGLLEIDAYLRDNPSLNDPGRPLDDVFKIHIEYSFIPGFMVGGPSELVPSVFRQVVLNSDLCSLEERQLLARFK